MFRVCILQPFEQRGALAHNDAAPLVLGPKWGALAVVRDLQGGALTHVEIPRAPPDASPGSQQVALALVLGQ